MKQLIKVGLIYGSARQGRFCDTVARWTEKELGASGNFTVEVIDPAAHSGAVATNHDRTKRTQTMPTAIDRSAHNLMPPMLLWS